MEKATGWGKKFWGLLIGLLLLSALITGGLTVWYAVVLPDSYYVSKGSDLVLPDYLQVSAIPVNPQTENYGEPQVLQSGVNTAKPVADQVSLKLFGLIPIKNVTVSSVDVPVLVPGGQPFGIKLLTDGVMVVGLGTVGNYSPAAEAGLLMGDVIIEMNGREVSSKSEVSRMTDQSKGEPIDLLVSRKGETILTTITPVWSEEAGRYLSGMWVRDSTAGIGTVTFYEQSTGIFGGLGHPVCDIDTGILLPLSTGEAASVSIHGVTRGTSGHPGELLGSFTSIGALGNLGTLGSLFANTECGLFGVLDHAPSFASAVPLALRQEINVGEAQILTTIAGCQPKTYNVRIEKVDLREGNTGKNMVIRITDPELLAATGGIVQGMSGSPILQNGKLVGAVTHVFVNDPTKGYGIFAETMYQNALTCSQ